MKTNGKALKEKRRPIRKSDVTWLRAMLESVPANIALEAGYYAARELRKSSLFEAPNSEPTKEGRALASKIVSDIAAREGINKADLSTQQAEYHLRYLLDAVLEVTRKAHPVKPGVGKRLLEKLRAQY